MGEESAARRPTYYDDAVKEAAARVMAARLAKEFPGDFDDTDDVVAGLKRYGRPTGDGYELARDLERYEFWDCDLQVAETLDGYPHDLFEAERTAEAEWWKTVDQTPPLPAGARVTHRQCVGTITGIYAHGVGKYEVKEDGEKDEGRRLVVNFEDCQALADVPAQTQGGGR